MELFLYIRAGGCGDDGLLTYDKDGDGTIGDGDEISFVSYVEGAQTDLEGLAYFDEGLAYFDGNSIRPRPKRKPAQGGRPAS